ncbi:DUF4065 domain-containing protein [Pantoea stewartii]|uniref:Panacea domain-containing protein n=1 Tax=Pantoea stewartii TaxID=66269 RepID=UPI0021D49646|nr:type II toxin-antitoxin system antitoxin SocA domain-containing protein [Pantoea stewartii]MCU7366814.1 DUF4065 domain-containing protein [Pantoea stewartii]
MYSPIQVANKFIQLAKESGSNLTHMQIQKLLYIAHGFSLAFYNKPLLNDPVCAWKYGPVIPSVYTALRQYRSSPVTAPVRCAETNFDEHTDALLNSIFDTYGKLSGTQLSEFTHRANTPWSVTREKHEDIISDNLIKNYYERLLESDQSCTGL